MDNYFQPIAPELVQYETRKVKGNKTIRAFLTILFALTWLCMVYYVAV